MFGRKKCPRCNCSISKKYAFCPYCGVQINEAEKFFEPQFNMGFPFNAIFRQLEKQIEKEFKSMDKHMDRPLLDMDDPEPLVKGLSINIDASNGNPVIRVSSMGEKQKKGEKEEKPKEAVGLRARMTDEKAEKLSSLPKEEARTTVRRLADRIIYEISVPGVDKENIIVTRLNNSIEIKAFSKDKAYFKLIPISLPILNSKLEEGKLVLELKPSH